MIDIDQNWKYLLNKIGKEASLKIVYVIGSNDSGKSTFCKFLTDNLVKTFRTVYIDCDPGQSLIGPPTTVGLEQLFQSWEEKSTQYFYFVGSTTPRGHLLQSLAGIKKLTEKAISLGAQRIIQDSCGFVLEQAAHEFQFRVIDLIQPDFLIVLQHADEDFRWVSNFKRHPKITLYRLPVSPSVIPRTPAARKKYREEKFKIYFENAVSQELILRGIGFYGRIPDLRNPKKYRNKMVALCDAENFVMALGLIQEINLTNKTFKVFAPVFDHSKVVFIHFGSIYLNAEVEQIFLPPLMNNSSS